MKKLNAQSIKVAAAALAAVTAISCTGVTACADKLKTVDGIKYRYSDSGEQLSTYTGWTKTSKGRRYYKDGVMYTNSWIKTKKGYYYAGKDGYMRTGWAKFTRGEGVYSYFDENGLWDGKTHYAHYQPNDLHSYLMDYDFLSGDTYYYSTTNYGPKAMKEFKDSAAVQKLLTEIFEADLYTPLEHDEISDDPNAEDIEVEINANIYHEGKKIIVKCSNDSAFEFTKDENGDSYMYYSSFGLKLKVKDAYDRIYKLMKK